LAVLENVTGAGGTTGITRAGMAPDSYTMVIASAGTHAGAAALYPHWSIEETARHVRALCSYLRSRVYFLIARRKPHPRQEVIGAAVKPHPHPSIKRKVRRNKINEPSHGILLRAG
jgi:hypothetical protein